MECTREEAIQAEATAAYIKTWSALEVHFNKYSHCDDGAISEGYSESVSFLLYSQWKEFLNYPMNDQFYWFIIKHNDETWEFNRTKAISKFAKENCNQSKKAICDAIISMENKK